MQRAVSWGRGGRQRSIGWLASAVMTLGALPAHAEEHGVLTVFGGLRQTAGLDSPLRFDTQDVRNDLTEALSGAGVRVVAEAPSELESLPDGETQPGVVPPPSAAPAQSSVPAPGVEAPASRLSGVVDQIVCVRHEHLSCRMAIAWQLSSAAGRVFYQTRTRDAAFEIEREEMSVVARRMAGHAFTSLLARPQFRLALQRGAPAAEGPLVTDSDDPLVSLSPPKPFATPSRKPLNRARRREPETPARALVFRWSGIVMTAVGTALITNSLLEYDSGTTTRKRFRELMTVNDIGWVLALLGEGCIVTSFLLTPIQPDDPKTAAKARGVTLQVGGRY